MKITLQDITDRITEQTDLTKKLSEDFLREFLLLIEESLNKDGIAKIKGLGTFKLLLVEERKSVNVQTGEEIIIPQHYKITFTPEKELKTAINKPFSHLETYTLSKDGPVDFPLAENEDEESEEKENEEAEIPTDDEQEKEETEIYTPVPVTTTPENNTEEQIIEPETEQIIEKQEEININNINMEEREGRKKGKNIWIIIFILIILGLIAFALYWCPFGCAKDKPNAENVQASTQNEIAPEEPVADEVTDNTEWWENENTQISENNLQDSENEFLEPSDSTTPNPNRKPEFSGEYMFDKKFDFRLVDYMQANYPQMKLITYGVPRDVEVTEGQRLTLVSLKYYGHKRFWVYIYLYNSNIIKDPDNIPAGLMIKVPRLDNSLVNPDNQANIDAAWDIQKYLLKM